MYMHTSNSLRRRGGAEQTAHVESKMTRKIGFCLNSLEATFLNLSLNQTRKGFEFSSNIFKDLLNYGLSRV